MFKSSIRFAVALAGIGIFVALAGWGVNQFATAMFIISRVNQ